MQLGFVGRMAARTAFLRAADELAERLADQTEAAIDTAVRLRARSLASGVEVERMLYPDLAEDLFLEHLIRQRAKISAVIGAVTAAPAIVPGAGSVVGLGASVVDTAAMLYSEVALIVELSAATGRSVADPNALTVDVLVVLALDAGVEIPEEMIAEARRGEVQADAIPRGTLGDLNRAIGIRVIKGSARRRARVLLGRELPFGIGVALGGVSNYRTMHTLGRTAVKHLTKKV
jgi:hypothetical protein